MADGGTAMRSCSPHGDSALTSSCFKTHVSPQTRIPSTFHGREEAMGGRRTAAVQNENDFDPEEKVYYVDSEDSLISSNLCGKSNEDYYKQIENLKNAHVHAMAQLEKLYESKLHVRSEIIASKDLCETPVYFSTTCKPSSDKKNDDHLSDLSTEVDSIASLNLSELSTEDLKADEDNLISHDRIRRMWDGFSLEMYTTCEKPEKLGSSNLQRTKIIKKENKHWSPKITIPEPFQMTLREDEKKRKKIRSRSEMEIENYTLRKQLEEEAECKKLFRANPAPAHTYIPLMEEIMERNEERRMFIKARNKEILLAMQKPFAFLEREEKKKEIQNMRIMDLAFSVKKINKFKAKPVPKYLHDQKIIDRIEEEELYRAIRMKVRAQEMLNSASLPKSMLNNAVLKRRKKVCCEPDKKLKFKPQINAKVPDFQILHRKPQRQLTEKKLATVCQPFQLHTSHGFSKNNIMNDTTADEVQLQEWPCRKESKSHIIIDLPPSRSLDLEIIKSTEASKKKEDVRNHQRKRTTNNFLEHDEMQERVNRRPFLLEVLAQRNAGRSAERYQTAAQKERRFKKEFVSWQNHSDLQSSGRESVENEDESSIYEESSQVETDGLDFDFQQDIEDKESSGVEENEDQESEAE